MSSSVISSFIATIIRFIQHNQPMFKLREPVIFIQQIPYFEQAGQAFIRDLASTSVMYFFPRGEIIQYSETITRELFCIRRGTCQVCMKELCLYE